MKCGVCPCSLGVGCMVVDSFILCSGLAGGGGGGMGLGYVPPTPLCFCKLIAI